MLRPCQTRSVFRLPAHALRLAAAAAAFAAAACRGELHPVEVAIVAARGNAESEDLARYYAAARAIPENNICFVDMPPGDVCPRAAWQNSIRPAIRTWLAEHDPERRLRCLATVWGVPLKIGPADPEDSQRAYADFLAGERAQRAKSLREAVKQFDQLAPAGELSTHAVSASPSRGAPLLRPSGETPEEGAADELIRIRKELEAALAAANARLSELPAGPAKAQTQAALQQLVMAAGGARVVVQTLESRVRGNPAPDPVVVSEYHHLRGAMAAWGEARSVLEQRPPSIERDALILAICERIGGMLEVIPWLDEQIEAAGKNETGASFDSELALVLWPDDYQLLRWQPNYLRPQFDASYLRRAFPILMTARIDAPTLPLARGMIDAAMAAERDGLKGKAYFDGRGVTTLADPPSRPGSVADFDRAILLTAQGIQDNTTVEAVLNTEPQLFQPGACPDAILYCGWYSLGKYIDAFDWRPGAVAYHVASSEAAALHDAASQQWCKRLIEDGVAVSIGPVDEPYLQAFPRPDDFFAMLLRGDLSLAECYWYSLPYASWTMVLLGDPLYQPYKGRSPVRRSEGAELRAPGR